MAFCKEYNAATQDKVGTVIPVEITVFEVSWLLSCHACSGSRAACHAACLIHNFTSYGIYVRRFMQHV